MSSLIEISDPILEIRQFDETHDIGVGIDFGTTNCVVCYTSKKERQFLTSHNSPVIPSLIAISQNGEFAFGFEALSKIDSKKWVTIKSVKRLISPRFAKKLAENKIAHLYTNKAEKEYVEYGEAKHPKNDIMNSKLLLAQSIDIFLDSETGEPTLKIFEKNYTITKIISKIFSFLKAATERQFSNNVEKCVITVPAHFDDASRMVVKRGAAGGFMVLRIINEPTSAAIAYKESSYVPKLNDIESRKECYVVYDFGGGTFDASVVKMKSGILQVLATGGSLTTGGDDIDIALAQYLYTYFSGVSRDEALLADKATEIKHFLSNNDEFDDGEFNCTRKQLEEIATPIIAETISILKDVVKDSGVEWKNVSGVVLVGGSSKMQLVTKMINSMISEECPTDDILTENVEGMEDINATTNNCNVPILQDMPLETIVASGAGDVVFNLLHRTKDNILLDIVPLSLGIEVAGGAVETLIPRNTPTPARSTEKFTISDSRQTGIDFHVVQGERAMAEDCISLARFSIQVPRKVPNVCIEVKFKVDVDGILSVTATETTTNTICSVVVNPSFGLTREKAMEEIKSAHKHAALDEKLKTLASTKFAAERKISSTEFAFEAVKRNNPAKFKLLESEVAAKIESLRHAITMSNIEDIEEKHDELDDVFKRMSSNSAPKSESTGESNG